MWLTSRATSNVSVILFFTSSIEGGYSGRLMWPRGVAASRQASSSSNSSLYQAPLCRSLGIELGLWLINEYNHDDLHRFVRSFQITGITSCTTTNFMQMVISNFG